MVLPTNRPTIPRTPPPEVVSSALPQHWPPPQNISTTKQFTNPVNKCMSRSESSKGLKCSFVIPDGPPAVPLRDDRKFALNLSSSRTNALAGSCKISGGIGSRGTVGLYRNWRKVASVPGQLCSFQLLPRRCQLPHLNTSHGPVDSMLQIPMMIASLPRGSSRNFLIHFHDGRVRRAVASVDHPQDILRILNSRYGLRGVRVGEASHPGPASKRRRMQRLRGAMVFGQRWRIKFR